MKNFITKNLLWLACLIFASCSFPLEGPGVKPEAVESLNLTGQDDCLYLSWDKIDLAESYFVYLDTSPVVPAAPYAKVDDTSITIPGLLNDITYYVWVKPSNERGDAPTGAVFSLTIPLSAPKEVTLTAPAGDTLNVSWNPVGLADEYEVFYSVNPVPPDAPQQTVTGTSAVLTGLDQPDYYVWVRAKNSRVVSDFGAMAQDTVTPLSAPEDVTLTAPSGDTLNVSWNPVSMADAYEVFYSVSPVPPATPQQTVTGTSVVLTGLDQPDYYVWVRSKNSRGVSAFSAMVRDTFTLPAPGGLKVSIVNETGLHVSWTAVSRALSYDVYYSMSSAPPPAVPNKTDITGTSTDLTGLESETTYYVWVQAKSGRGNSPLSSMAKTPVMYYRVSSATEFSAAITAINQNAEDAAIIVTGNFPINTSPVFSGAVNKTITLKGDGSVRSLINYTGEILFTIPAGITLVLDNNLTLGGYKRNSSVVSINTGGAFTMKNTSAITDANTSAVYINGGTFTMSGGIISGNTASNGGGVFMENGTFTMSGGTINGNVASHGGGVFMRNGTFTMSGGTINGNVANYSGGGGGGGVYIQNGTFIMSDGTISGNTTSGSYSYGGGVSVSGSGFFSKTGGTIDDTNAANYGKVAYVGSSPTKIRNAAAGPGVNLNSGLSGGAGGWE
ncbi:MAG: fibronectin type III domain-containing protein [Treponema sp.]|jgi:hypothetical protein|nr:fibronectin type III domain-containing protein [Treponema sp.]